MVKNLGILNNIQNKDNLETLFCQIANRCFEINYLMDTLKKDLKTVPIFTRMRLKSDFKKKIGLTIDEFNTIIKEVSALWSDIERSINHGEFSQLEQYLRTYNCMRIKIYTYLTSFPRYRKQMHTYEYKIPRELTEETMGKIIWVTKDLNLSLRQIYSMLKL